MPERFQPDNLISTLRPFDAAVRLTASEEGYRRFYGFREGCAKQTRMGRIQVGDYQIALQGWWPEQARASLILLHGYYDHGGLYRHVVEWALEMGFAVLSFDLPGHGLSSGRRASINDFAEYQTVLQAVLQQAQTLDLPKPWHLFGQSTGGAILIDYLLNGAPQEAIGETILMAPLVRPRAWNWSKLSYHLMRGFVSEIPRRFSVNSTDAQFIDFVHNRDPLQPRMLPTTWVGALSRWVPRIESAARSPRRPLIVQGEQDMTVAWQHNLEVLQDKFAGPEILRLSEARHHLSNERPEFRERFFGFLSEQLR